MRVLLGGSLLSLALVGAGCSSGSGLLSSSGSDVVRSTTGSNAGGTTGTGGTVETDTSPEAGASGQAGLAQAGTGGSGEGGSPAGSAGVSAPGDLGGSGGTGGTGSARGIGGTSGTGSPAGSAGESGTGSGGSDVGAGGSAGGGLAPGYHLLAAYWNGSVEVIDELDPTTGLGSYVGTMGNLHYWTGQYKLNVLSNRLYVMGMDVDENWRLYTLDLTTGENAEIPVEPNTTMFDVTPDDKLLVARWTGSIEQLWQLDPITGESTWLGQFGNLHGWYPCAVYDPTTHIAAAFGLDENESYFLYTLNIDTHVDAKIPVDLYETGHFAGVRASNRLVYAVYGETTYAIQTIDPTTGEMTRLTPWADIAGLPDVDGISYDPTTDTAYVVKYNEGGTTDLHTFHLATQVHTQVSIGNANILASLLAPLS